MFVYESSVPPAPRVLIITDDMLFLCEEEPGKWPPSSTENSPIPQLPLKQSQSLSDLVQMVSEDLNIYHILPITFADFFSGNFQIRNHCNFPYHIRRREQEEGQQISVGISGASRS